MNKFIPSLTPLRGIAASLVVFFHYHIILGPLTSPDITLISKLYLMVDLFFVLSGFILAHVYGDQFQQKIGKRSFLKFMGARFARIYPLHLVTFLYLFIWVFYMRTQIDFLETPAVVQSIFDYTAIPWVLSMTQAWGTHIEATWNSASWSISVEWFLYLIFPFLAFLILKSKCYILWGLGIGSFIFLFVIAYAIEPVWIEEISKIRQNTEAELVFRTENSIDIITGFALLRGFCSFIFGMLTYEIYRKGKFKKIMSKGFWFPIIWGILIIGWTKNHLPDPFAIPLFSILILHTAYAEGALKRVLNSKVFTYLGNISYSIYMVHVPLIFTLFILSLIEGGIPAKPEEVDYFQNWIGAVILLGIVIIIASITYYLIERPARKGLRNIRFLDK